MTLICSLPQVTPEGWVIIAIALTAIFWGLYDLDRMNRRSAREAREELQDLTEKEKQKLDDAKIKFEGSYLKPKRSTVIAVQLSLL